MAIIIGNKYKIESDKLNVTVSTFRHSEKKGDVWDNEFYFSSVEAALKYLIDREVLLTEMKDLKTIIDAINSAKSEILKALSEQRTEAVHETLTPSGTSDQGKV
jgi:hypothetical protein